MSYYEKSLNDFCGSVKHYKNQIGIHGIFLPHVLSGYSDAPKKYFYCGQDTYGWFSFDAMIDCYERGRVTDYIEENNSWPTEDDMCEYSQNKANFWTLVIRLHIFLNFNEIINVNEISTRQKEVLNQLGWGNLNAIEKPSSLRNQKIWDSIDPEYYWDIKEKSRTFDALKHILDQFDPDYIFIFNWDSGKEADTFKGLNPHWNEDEYIEGVISTYTFDQYKAKVIWCLHPNRLRYKSMNINSLVELIATRL